MMGVVEAYQTKSDARGMAGVTGKDADRFKFKVPTLRNLKMIYPYFHDVAARGHAQFRLQSYLRIIPN